MTADTAWEPFGIPGEEYDQAQERTGRRVLNLTLPRLGAGRERDRGAFLALPGVSLVVLSHSRYAFDWVHVGRPFRRHQFGH